MLFSTKIFSVLVFEALYLCVITGRIKRVIGGKEVICGTQRRVASLRNATTNQHLCGATLLSTDFAITAAHCVQHTADQFVLHLNNYCAKHVEVPIVKVLEVIVNGLYDEYTIGHDIALLRISCGFDDTNWLTQSVLPKSSFGLSGECMIYGYGYKNPDVKETSEALLAGPMSVVSLDECLRRLGPYVAPRADGGMLCAMGAGVDACQGDSGSPLLCSGVVQGVSSYGMSCGVPGLPGVYTSVGAHLQWIRDTIKNP